MTNAIANYEIQYPEKAKQVFGEVKSQILDTSFSRIQLQNLRDIIEQKIKQERDECYLFMVGDRVREDARAQFGVLCQVLELNSIDVVRLRPVRDSGDSGELRWTITHRSWLVSAMLVLRATDDAWAIRPIPLSDRQRRIMTEDKAWYTDKLNDLSLERLLYSKQVPLDGLGGWNLAS